MKSTLTCSRQPFGILTLLLFTPLWVCAAGQNQGEPVGEQPPVPAFRRLPNPLDGITGNILDLERSGHFQIVDAQIGRTRQFEQEALIWTVSVRRAILCSHAQILLRNLADARFYRIERDAQWREQVHITRLYYPNWIDSGAAHGETIPRDERFEIWIPLTNAESARLRQEKTNRLVLSHLERRTVLPETTKRSKPLPGWKPR
jgi:hypothetical protein